MMQKTPVNPEQDRHSEQPPALKFMPDSMKQVKDSINRIGYRTKLDKVFRATIKRVKKGL